MELDARQILYQNFDRKVGNPKQYIIHNTAELNNFITTNSGQNDECYASSCLYIKGKPIFDDLFLEEDNKNIKAIATIGQYYSDNDIPWIPLYSANRSFHIHAPFQPENISQLTIKKFAATVLKETHNESTMDEHVTGDISRLHRIPNTQRINGRWCIPLSHEDVLNQLPLSHFIELSKSPQFINYNISYKPRITEFVKECTFEEIPQQSLPKHISTPQKFRLKDFVRGCICKKLYNPNPSNMIRNAATRDALLLGLTSQQLAQSYSELNWVDYDPSYTKERIDYIQERISQGYVRHFGKERLGCTSKLSCLRCILKGDFNDKL
jgi:hypothetical protein